MNKKYKNFNILAGLIIISFLILQINSLKVGGTTWDERSMDNANILTYEKLEIVSNFDFFSNNSLNPSLTKISSAETYGQFISFQQFLFSRALYDTEFTENYFSNNNMYSSFYSKISYLRNLYLTVYTSFLLIVCYFLISKFQTKKFAVIFLLLLILIPSFSGHSLFNQKDIMFMFHIFFVSFLIIKNINSFTINKILLISFFSGLAISLRISAAGFIALCVLFCMFHEYFIENNNRKFIFRKYSYFSFFSLFFYFIFSPSGWFNPIEFVQESINQQILLEWDGSILTNGEFILSRDMDRFYLIKWYFYKLPLIYHFFILLAFSSLSFKKLKKDKFYIYSLFFLFSVNLAFMLTKPGVYDGIRQFLFLLPFIVYISASILNQLENSLIYVLPLIIFYLIYTQSGLGPYKYVYFNELVDEEKITYDCENIDGCGEWLTDYWGYSSKEMAQYVNTNNLTNVYFCKTVEFWDPYVVESLEPIYTDTSKLVRGEVIVATIYRPRFSDDGCDFNRNDINYDCQLVHKTTTLLRGHEVDLSYLKVCKINT